MEQNADTGAQMTPAVDNRQKNGSGLKIATAIACVVAACGIGFGVYGIMQSAQRDNRITELETQLANIKSEIQDNTSSDIDDNKNSTANNNIGDDEDNIIDNSATLGFDFDAMLASLESSIKNSNMVPIMSKCTNYENNKGEPVSDCSYTTLSKNTIESIIKKLKSAESVDKEITFSFIGAAPSITYLISVDVDDSNQILSQRVFSLNYSPDLNDKILLVGFGDKGYAFHFNDIKVIDGFIESLASIK